MKIKSTNYKGMDLKSDIRESISLDDDDLSDVEDEVFFRDGKNCYKLAEDFNVKRPLMAPRRKIAKLETGSRIKPKQHCRTYLKPWCYAFTLLSTFIVLIVLVVTLISKNPYPLDKLKDFISRATSGKIKILPCTNFKVTTIWLNNLQGLTSDSPIRTVDINGDGIDDILFGFGIGDDYKKVPQDVFCPIWFNVDEPCNGGVIALNGATGNIIWRHWFNDTIFNLECSADLNGDHINDCLATGIAGTITVINSKNGHSIWQLNKSKSNIYMANFISDQNGDNASDILTSSNALDGSKNDGGYLLLLCGKTGKELLKIAMPNQEKTFFMPQLLLSNNETWIIFGTGTPNTAGNLNLVQIEDVDFLVNKTKTIYKDKYKGMMTQVVLVDITEDAIPDIIAAAYNATLIAINGKTFKQVWNYTIPNAITNISPTPAYFNSDNITDFLVIYQNRDDVFHYNYTKTLIIDGRTGQPIYQPLNGALMTQMNALTLSMEGKGHDVYLFWTSECSSTEQLMKNDKMLNKSENDTSKLADDCRIMFNSSTILRLNALNQYHQPPGITIYNSALQASKEEDNIISIMDIIDRFTINHPSPDIEIDSKKKHLTESDTTKEYNETSKHTIEAKKYGKSNFRHKEKPNFNEHSIFRKVNQNKINTEQQLSEQESKAIPDQQPPLDDYNIWMPGLDLDPDFDNYNYGDDTIPYNQKQIIFNEMNADVDNRDPRSKDVIKVNDKKEPDKETLLKKRLKTKKKNLSDRIYSYRNVRLAKNQLLNDQENLPTDILKETYFKNEESRLKKSKFEQRDTSSNSHHLINDINKALDSLKNEKLNPILNGSITLWDLENEKEMREREGYDDYNRKKRQDIPEIYWDSIHKMSSVGVVLNSIHSPDTNSIDIVFMKYWLRTDRSVERSVKSNYDNCMKKARYLSVYFNNEPSAKKKETFKEIIEKCKNEKDDWLKNFIYYNELAQFNMAQMSIYRLRLECECDNGYKERCVRFMPNNLQGWSEYLGPKGDGVFRNTD